MSTVIQTVIIKLGSDISEAAGAMNKIGIEVQKFGKTVSRTGEDLTKNFTAPLLAAGAAAVAVAVHVGTVADELGDLREQTGLTTDQLQEYRFVALQAGADQDAVADAAFKLTAKLSDTGDEAKATQQALASLGVKAHDASGGLRPMSELLPEVISKLQGMDDVTRRNTIAADLFGKGYVGLAPLLGLTAAATDDARKRAHELGLVLSGDALKAADDFRIMWQTTRAELEALGNQVGVALIPVFKKFGSIIETDVLPMAREFVTWVGKMDTETVVMTGVVAALVAAIGPLLFVGGKLISMYGLLLTPMGATVAAIAAIGLATVQVIRHWDDLKLQGVLVWTALKDTVFSAVSFILGALEKLPFVGTKITALKETFDAFAEESLAKSGRAIAAMEADWIGTETVVTKVAETVTKAATKTDAAVRKLSGAGLSAAKIFSELHDAEAKLKETQFDRTFEQDADKAKALDKAAEELTAKIIALKEALLDADIPARKLDKTWLHIPSSMKNLHPALKSTADKLTEFQRTTQGVAQSALDSLADFALGSKEALSNFVESAIRDLARLFVKMLAIKVLQGALGASTGGFGGFLLGALGGGVPGKATGGPVYRGRPFLVGERGPELFVPGQNGSIVSNNDLGGGGNGALLAALANAPRPMNPREAAQDAWWREFVGHVVRDGATR